ncbi:TIM barrel protein [Saccharopolyspora sp. NPDC002686]|uniref:sugar phosphate isomerase/epimerase family protein n=1 Tax=Saccharopolyspora sp. NPDC002686 TaxID=3154541 RepID=UPI00332CD9B3
MTVDLTASFVTLSGAGFAEPARIPFAERCRAAADAGFTGIGLHAEDYRRMRDAGVTDGELRSLLAEHSLRLDEIEFLNGWLTAAGTPCDEDITALGAAFQPHHVTAGEFGSGAFTVEEAGARLRKVCDRFDGMRVAVEGFPWSSLRNVATARAVVEASGATNAGLMIDVWHFYNGRSTLADLDGLPPERIVAVQLNDGRIVDDDFRTEARRGRLLPGDGDLDVIGLVRGLHERGFRGPYCIEVNYPAFRDQSPQDMAQKKTPLPEVRSASG